MKADTCKSQLTKDELVDLMKELTDVGGKHGLCPTCLVDFMPSIMFLILEARGLASSGVSVLMPEVEEIQ